MYLHQTHPLCRTIEGCFIIHRTEKSQRTRFITLDIPPSLRQYPLFRTWGVILGHFIDVDIHSFGDQDSVFVDMGRLNPNTQTYQPKSLPGREVELDQLHSVLRPATMGLTPKQNTLFHSEFS